MDSTRVLVVDDNAMFIEMASFVLNAAACAVDSAGDASQALLKIASFSPNLILMDVQMPGIDGYIAKPFDVAMLAATVHAHLAGRRSASAATAQRPTSITRLAHPGR